MSSITLPSSLSNSKLDTYTRLDGADTVHVQAVISANPLSPTAGTLTAAAQSVVATGLADMDGVTVTTAGTFSGTLAFEGSVDGVNWYSIILSRASSLTAEATRALTGATLEAWRGNIAGFTQFRVRCSAYTSGAASINIAPCPAPIEPFAVSGQSVVVSSATLAAGANLAADVANGVRTTATNALLRYKLITAASTNAAALKAAAGRVYGWSLSNTTAAWKFVKIYNLAVAPTVGTSVPVETIGVPPNGTVEHVEPIGVSHATGIAIAVTNLSPDTDATAVAVGDVVGAIYYA